MARLKNGYRSEVVEDDKYHILSMDYENFIIVIMDGIYCRLAAIFTVKPSPFFTPRLRSFMEEFEEIYAPYLQSNSGSMDVFNKADNFFNKYIHYSMTRPIELNLTTKAKNLQKDINLSVEEMRMMNVIQSFLREKDYVRLRTVVNLYGTTSKNAELIAVKGIVGFAVQEFPAARGP